MNARISGRKANADKSQKHSAEGSGTSKGSESVPPASSHMSLGIMDEATIAQGAMRALEPRILLDAAMDATMDAIGDASDALSDADRIEAQTQADNNDAVLAALKTETFTDFTYTTYEEGLSQTAFEKYGNGADAKSGSVITGASNSIVFVDESVTNFDALVSEFGPDIEVVVIETDTDGVEQMAAALDGRKDMDAIHIISHGRSGTLDLGSTKLTEASMNTRHADEMATIRAALSDDADILIYGCDFGANARGASAVQALADFTGADVAASEDLTGAAALGGDWDLEVKAGTIEAVGLESETYAHTLIAPTIGLSGMTLNYVAYDRTDSSLQQFVNSASTGDGDGDAIQSIRMTIKSPTASDGVNESITFGSANTKTITLGATPDSGTFDQFGKNYTVSWTPTSDGNGEFLMSRTDGSGMYNPETGYILAGMRYQNVSAINSAGGRNFYFHAIDVNGDETLEPQIPIVIAIDGEPLATTDMSVLSADDLANALVGDGITIVPGSVTFFGADTQAGTFTNGTTAAPGVIGFDDGLIFSTGSIDTFAQANRSDSTSGIAGPVATTDADFTALGGITSRDPAYLEFSFIPDTDTITLQYIFGSEEYDEFVGSGFNDNFGIFVNGQNVAVLPDGEAVTINTINAGQNQSLFVDNEIYNTNVPGLEAGPFLTEADGFTQILSAIANVIPNQVNTIKIGIADILDQTRDSWAVVRADSFASNPVANTDLFYSAPAAPVTIDLTDNDTDPEGDPLEVVELNGVPWSAGSSFTLASGVTLTMNGTGAGNQTVTATPPPGNTLDITDAVSYQITDPGGNTAVGIANIIFSTVPPVDAVDDGYTMPDPTQQFTTPSVILNDSDPGETPAVNAPTLSVSGVFTTGTQGTVVNNGNGTFTYTPPAGGLVGTDSFDYIITDGQTSDRATVTINGAVVNFAPTITGPATAVVNEDGSIGFSPDFDIQDSDSTNVTMTFSVDGTYGTLNIDNAFASVIQSGNGSDTVTLNGTPAAVRDAIETLQFAPAADFNTSILGTIPLTVTATDGTDAATPFVTNITVNPVVDTAPDTLSTDDVTPITFNVLTGNSGASADNFEGAPQVTSITQPASGSATLDNADGTITFTPAAGFIGSTNFSYTVTSGGVTETETVTINIGTSNQPPVAEDDQLFTTENGTDLSGSVITANGTAPGLVGDLDPNGDTLTVTQVNGLTANLGTALAGTAGGLFTINNDGSYLFSGNGDFEDLAAGETRDTTVTYTIDDGNGGTDTATVTVTVTGANDAPLIVTGGEIPDQTGTDAELITPIDVTGAFVDADTNDTLSYTATGLPAGLVLNATTGLIEGTLDPSASQNGNMGAPTDGVYSITVTADDGNGGTATDTFLYTVTNPAPNATNDAVTVSEDGPASTFNVITDDHGGAGVDSDPDGDTPLTVSQVNGDPALVGTSVAGTNGGTFTINSDGSTSFDPGTDFNGLAAGEQETTTVEYQVSDGEGGFDTAVVTMTVDGANDAPDAVDDTENINENDIVNDSVLVANLGLPDSDPEGDTLTVTDVNGTAITSGAVITLPSGALLTMNNDGTYTYDTNGVFAGLSGTAGAMDSFTYTIADGNGGTDTATVNINIAGLNGAPVAVDDVETINEDDVISESVLVANGGLPDSDPDGDTLTVTDVNGTAITPGAVITLPSGALLTMNGDGTYTYDTNGVFDSLPGTGGVSDTFTYSISDGNGGTDTATVRIDIAGQNDAPIPQGPANPGTPADAIPPQTGNDSSALPSLDVTPYFSDVDDAALTYSLDPATTPSWMTMDASGNITGTPPADASQLTNTLGNADGVYTITVIATDPAGLTGQTTVDYTISNPAPDALDDDFTTNENDGSLTGNVVTGNNGNGADFDPDGDAPLTVIDVVGDGVTGVGAPLPGNGGGLFTITSTGGFTFDGNGDFEDLAAGETRDTTVTYTIDDGNGGTDTAIVTVTVTGANDAPLNVTGSEIPDQTGTDAELITPIDVTGAFVDTDTNDTLSYTATGLPAGLALNATTGLIEGTLDPSASQNGNTGTPTDGVYSIIVTADDGNGGTATDTFLYTVTNPAPNATDDMEVVSEDGPASTFNVITDDNGGAGVDNDPDGDTPLTVSQVNGDPALVGTSVAGTNGGTFTINSDGSTSFDPGTDFNGLALGEQETTTVEYQVSDGEGGFDTAVVTMTVAGANDAPVIIDPNDPPPDPTNPAPLPDPNIIPQQSVNDGADYATTPLIDVSDYIQDPDQTDVPTYSTTDPLPAGLTLNADGTITGVVDNSASQGGPNNDGIYPISVTVSDGNGGTVDIPLTIDVSNLPPVAVDDVSSGTEDASQSGNLISDPVTGDADTPTDSDPLFVSEIEGTPVVAGPPTDIVLTNGTLSVSQDGAWTFAPNGNANVLNVGESLQEVVTYQVSDGEGSTSDATLTITINGLNDPVQVVDPNDPNTDPQDPLYDPENPAVVPDPANLITDVTTVDGETPPSIQAGDYFADAENDTLVFSATDLPAGLTIDAATGEISGTIDNSASQSGNTSPGVYDVVITAIDPQGNTAQTTVTYTITNPPVVAQNDDLYGSESAVLTGSVYDDNGNGIDMDTPPDSDDLTVNLVNGSAANVGQATAGTGGGQFMINPDGTYTFDPGNDFQNLAIGAVVTTSVTYQITDGEGSTSQATVTVTVDGTNDSPIPVDPSQPVLPNPNDPTAPPSDPNDPRLPPNDPLNYIPVQTATDGQTDFPPLDLTPYFGDPDAGDALALSLDANDLPAGLTFDPAMGIISGVPSGDASQGGDPLNPGTYVIPVTATDPEGLSFTTNVTFVISNLPPLAQNDDLTVDEDTPLTANVFDNNNNGFDADTSPDSDAIIVSQVDGAAGNIGQPVAGSDGGSFVIGVDGALTFDPGADFQDLDETESRTTTVTYQISDGQGGISDATVTVTVTGINDGPVVIDPADPGDPKEPNTPTNPNDLIDLQTTTDGEDLTPLDISGYFTDVDDEPLIYTLDPGTPSWVVIDPNTGVITGTSPTDGSQGGPANDGIYPIIVTATDPEGETASTSFDLAIENVQPVAVDDVSTGTEDDVQTGNVITDGTTGDADGGSDADPLTVTMVQGQPIVPGTPTIINLTNGSLEMSDDGAWSFTPNGNANVLDVGETLIETITYQIDDGQGGTDSAELTVTIEGVNDPVVLVDPDNPETDPTNPDYSPDNPLTPDNPTTLVSPLSGGDDLPFPPFDVTPYFGDAEGDVLTYTATDLPEGLTIDPQTGIISGTPASDASVNGPYQVTVTATDPNGNTAELPFTIEIENQPPVLDIEVPDRTIYPGQPLTVALPTYFSDPDNDDVTYTAQGIPPGFAIDPQTGLITGSADPQTVTGGPNGDGIFVITVTVDDGQGGTATDLFEIKVLPQSFVAPPQTEVPILPELPVSGSGPGDEPPLLPITSLISDLSPLGPNTGIDNPMHPLDAVIKQYGDSAPDTALDGSHYIDALVRHIDKLLAQDGQNGGEFGAHGDQTHPYLGNDAHVKVALDRDTVLFRSMVWNGQVYVEILGAYGGKVFGDFRGYHVTGPDGGALPSWINQRASNLVLIDRPANVEAIAIEVQITLRDGSVTSVPMVIDLLTGDINVSQSVNADAQISGTFTDRVAALADAPLEEQNALFAALKNHTV